MQVIILVSDVISVGVWKELADLGAHHVKKILDRAMDSRAEGTVCKDLRAYRHWKSFSQVRGIQQFPVQPAQLAIYLEHIADSTGSKSAVEEDCNAIAWTHEIAGIQNPLDNGVVRSIVEGCHRSLAKPVKKKELVTMQDLKRVIQNTNTVYVRTITTPAS